MKYFLLLILAFSINFQSHSQVIDKDQVTSYYLIRHAEKDRSNSNNKDPHLTEEGLIRAQKWASTLKRVQFDIIYSTNYYRTKETALPIANANDLEITIYDPGKIYLNKFLNDTRGKTVLIVGHSNSIPNIVNSLIGKKKYKLIDDTNNSNLYLVVLKDKSLFDQIFVID